MDITNEIEAVVADLKSGKPLEVEPDPLVEFYPVAATLRPESVPDPFYVLDKPIPALSTNFRRVRTDGGW